MSRVEKTNGKFSLAFGVDRPLGQRTFVQVWNCTEFNMPDAQNLVVSEWNIDIDRVISLAKKYKIKLDSIEVFDVFD